MKKILMLLVAMVLVAGVSAQSRIEEFRVKSAQLGVEKVCSVYLPDGYDRSDKHYPVLYLLHGAGGCHTNWLTIGALQQLADESIAEGTALPMIVVMPDAAGEGQQLIGKHMGYFNVPGWNYETFFFEEFLPAVEQHYRAVGTKAQRAIAGLSMGGGGTTLYAMRHPERFGSACPLSALIDTLSRKTDYDPVFVQSVAQNSAVRLLQEMTEEQVAQQRTVRWWVDCGDDDFLYEGNSRFYNLMRERNIPLQFRVRDGSHTWRYWQQAMPSVLTFISIGFAE